MRFSVAFRFVMGVRRKRRGLHDLTQSHTIYAQTDHVALEKRHGLCYNIDVVLRDNN